MAAPDTWETDPEGALVADLALGLRYRHGFGALSPFLRALQEGRALASRCPACDDVRFPPRRLCLHDRTPTVPHPLDGTGEVLRLTTGVTPIPLAGEAREETFAEIAMHGADNRVLARLRGGPAAPGARVRLLAPAGELEHPIQALVFEPS